MKPAVCKPKIIIMIPAIILSILIFLDSNFPNVVADAPNKIKMREKPRINAIELIIIFFVDTLPDCISCNDTPDIYEIYAGMRGKTQGETNDKKPAKIAVKIEILFIRTSVFISIVYNYA